MCSISQWSILSLITSEVLIYHEHLVQGNNCLISKDSAIFRWYLIPLNLLDMILKSE